MKVSHFVGNLNSSKYAAKNLIDNKVIFIDKGQKVLYNYYVIR